MINSTKSNHLKTGIIMKKTIGIILALSLLSGCAPEIGSKEWCASIKEKPKADWTIKEGKEFASNCIF